MYSAVLAAVLIVTPSTPNFCFKGCGCWGGCHRCYGCGCYGCGCYGCGCYGCGCYGCGCYGCGCYGCGCYGCGCYACYGCGCGGIVVVPVVQVAPQPKEEPKKASNDQATVLVRLPADANLWVDGMKSNQTASTRSIVTPRLEANRQYFYTVKAEIVRDGKTLVESKRVALRAGVVSEVEFTEAGLIAANTDKQEPAPAKLIVKLPEDAKLYVDNVECTLTSSVRSFSTPKLEAGQSYFYTLKAEVVRDGKTVTDSKKVVLEAGKNIEVEFDALTSALAAK